MTKKQIYILVAISTVVILLPYILQFMGSEVSSNTADWSNFSTYISGLIMPILTIANLMILVNVNNSIKGNNDKRDKLYKILKRQMEKGDFAEFRVDIEKQESVEESLAILDEKEKDVYGVLDALAEEVGDKDFEMACLATPNTKARLDIQIAQLKVNIYQELFNASGKAEHEKALDKAIKELKKLHKDTYLAD